MIRSVIWLRYILLMLAAGIQVNAIAGQLAQPTTPPIQIEKTLPKYPEQLKSLGLNGKVILEFVVNKGGAVSQVTVVESTNPDFNDNAVEAVKQWKFKPALINGKKVSVRMQVPLMFEIHKTKQKTETIPHGIYPLDDKFKQTLGPSYDSPPMLLKRGPLVYPFPELLNNGKTIVVVLIWVQPNGRIGDMVWGEKIVEEPWREAVTAMLATTQFSPALKGANPVGAMMQVVMEFNPSQGEALITTTASKILYRLQEEGETAVFSKPSELDKKLIMVKRVEPIFPRQLHVIKGDAVIEFFIDQEGHAQLPRIITASEPAFGYSACQAIASWRFEPPLKDGEPVVVKVRVPVEFKRE